jgi:hypothetical protein
MSAPRPGERRLSDVEIAALEAVLRFRGNSADLGQTIAGLERALVGATREVVAAVASHAGVDRSLLEGALLAKSIAAQIDVVLHSVGIVQALPYVLDEGEQVLSTSLGAGNTGRRWDLETNRQVAEFKFIRWKGKDSIRQNTLFVDLFHLAEADTTKRKVLYVTGIEWPQRFLAGDRAITSVLEKHGRVASSFTTVYGDTHRVVSDYWSVVRDRVELVDLEGLVPGLRPFENDD